MSCLHMNRGVDGQLKILLLVRKRFILLLKRLFPLFLMFLAARQDVVLHLTLLMLRKDSKKSDTEEHDSGSIEDTFKRHLRCKLGCLGVPVAFYGIYEAQARMALHVHGLFWTLLNAELLSQYTQKDIRRISLLIDQLIAT